MDGADISDPEMGGSTFSNFNVDAVQEIQSMSGWMPAEVGRGASGFTNIITRSGAAGFHGSIFEFVRNSSFDARAPLLFRPKLDVHQWLWIAQFLVDCLPQRADRHTTEIRVSGRF